MNATDTDGNRYWVAQCLAKDKHSEAVLHNADKTDPGWGIKRGDAVMNVQWYERSNKSNNLVFRPGIRQKILLRTILPLKVVWQKTTTDRYYISEYQHADFDALCDSVLEIK